MPIGTSNIGGAQKSGPLQSGGERRVNHLRRRNEALSPNESRYQLLGEKEGFRLLGAPKEGKEGDSATQAKEQGIHYHKSKKYGLALGKLEPFSVTEAGKEDFQTWDHLSKIYYEIGNLEKAVPAAKKALELAKEDKDKRNAEQMLRWLNQFGKVTFDLKQGTVKEKRISLELTKPLINVDKKKFFEDAEKRFQSGVKLPITLYLPVGKYYANGSKFEVPPQGKETKVFLPAEKEPKTEVVQAPLKPEAIVESPKAFEPPMETDWLTIVGGVAVGMGALFVVGIGFAGREEQGITIKENKKKGSEP